jgi:hypothetical protein
MIRSTSQTDRAMTETAARLARPTQTSDGVLRASLALPTSDERLSKVATNSIIHSNSRDLGGQITVGPTPA